MKRPQKSIFHTSSGFTLIELLVVVAMVGILAAVVAPSWLGFLNRQRISSVKSDLVQVLKQSQQTAIQRRQVVSITVREDEAYPTINNGIDQILAANSGIRPDMIKLNTFSVNSTNGETSDDAQFAFNYQGKLIDSVNAQGREVPQTLPLVITISSPNFNQQQCVILANLIGSIKTAEGATCDNPGVAPVDPS